MGAEPATDVAWQTTDTEVLPRIALRDSGQRVLKPGYKQTEVWVIPEDWKVEPLKSITSIKTGPFGTLLKADEYSSGEGTPLISVGEVGEGMLRVDDHTPLVPPSVVRRLPEYVLNCGDIVLGRKGAVDRSALVSENQAGWFLGSDGIRIRPSKSCYPPFVAWQFQRNAIKAWLLQNATGTTMASMNQGTRSEGARRYAATGSGRISGGCWAWGRRDGGGAPVVRAAQASVR